MIGGIPSGQNEFRTAGLIFVPPISCAIPNAIDNIISPNVIGSMTFGGGVMITAMRDSLVEVRIDGQLVSLGTPGTVRGNPDFVTYRNLTLFSQTSPVSNISIVARGAVQVAMYGQNNAASFAAFYSGFSKTKKPKLDLTNIGDGVCPDTLVVKGIFDGIQWTYEDTILKYGKDTFLIIAAPGRYIAEGYLGVCRRSETAADTLDINFKSPAFAYSTRQPSCFGYSNGQIVFGTPYGGFPPYQFSVDNGKTFSKNNTFTNVSAGTHKLIARDSLGCYNRPLQITLGQPPQLKVDIVSLIGIPEVINEGQMVKLKGIPNRKVVKADWTPADATNCVNCLETYTLYPIESTHITLLVTDSAGCTALDTFSVKIQPNVYAPNVISPSSESNNKAFTIFSKEPLSIRRLAIFDRWGEHLFEGHNLVTNDVVHGWDGTFKGKRVPQEVYVYVAEVEVLPGRFILVKGDVTVIYP
jgi:gliding motility-associated-like protein